LPVQYLHSSTMRQRQRLSLLVAVCKCKAIGVFQQLLLLRMLWLLQARRSADAAAGSRSPGKKLLGMLHLRKATERALMYMPASMRRIPVQVCA
jgi:hypothetical protein